ncbi:hypothetical protein ACROYT_G013889 [Oculina patagonica]
MLGHNILIRTLLPTTNRLLRPQVVDGVAEKIKVRRQKAKYYFDRGSKELPELKIGQPVRVKPSPSQRENKWRLGTCVQQVAPRSYIVDVSGRCKKYPKNVPKISAQEGTANGSVQELSKLKELFPTEDEVDFDTVLKCSFNLEHAIDTLVNRSVDH